jgi:hypothetical protein
VALKERGMTPGDVMPDFVFRLEDGTKARFYGKVGGEPGIVCFDDTDALQKLGKDTGVSLFVVTEEELHKSFGVDAVLFGADLRVIASWSDTENWGEEARALIEKIEQVEPNEVSSQAPVLLLPNILEAEFCDRLITLWHKDHDETGVEHEQARKTELVDSLKRRSDHIVVEGPLMRELTQRLGRRLIPSIKKAFGFQATRFEGFKIGRYDSDVRGFFHRHRDNLSPKTAHRKFALTLNLNDGYEGGHLEFPEYGPHRYRPGKGSAIIFSASLMHEAIEVSKGQRFVLISFLF